MEDGLVAERRERRDLHDEGRHAQPEPRRRLIHVVTKCHRDRGHVERDAALHDNGTRADDERRDRRVRWHRRSGNCNDLAREGLAQRLDRQR